MSTLTGLETRQLIAERVRRASEPHLPRTPRRHQLATRLRKLATQIDNWATTDSPRRNGPDTPIWEPFRLGLSPCHDRIGTPRRQ